MTDDLVKRLRDPAYKGQEQMRAAAADRIEALERESNDMALLLYAAMARIEELEAALQKITCVKYYGMEGAEMESDEMKSIARAHRRRGEER